MTIIDETPENHHPIPLIPGDAVDQRIFRVLQSDGEWEDTPIAELCVGDVVCAFDDENPVEYNGVREFLVVEEAALNEDGVMAVTVDPVLLKSGEKPTTTEGE